MLDNTTATWISRTVSNIRRDGLEAWELGVDSNRDLITVQAKSDRKPTASKPKARKQPKFVGTFVDGYVAKLTESIEACAVNSNGKYVTSAVFNDNVKALMVKLDKALAA